MVIQPRVRGFICTTAHPLGCEKAVEEQINYIKKQGEFTGAKNVLVIGASTGYGLASRIALAYGANANTIGVFYEKEADSKRTASAGWYNSAAFEKFAHRDNLYAKSINGDAFSDEIKQQTIDLIRRDLKQIDLVVYSLASPRRVDPDNGQIYSSVLKPIGQSYTSKTVDFLRGEVKEITLEAANPQEIAETVAVMGGDDWERWIDLLMREKLLSPNAVTIAYTYIGPKLTFPIYKEGTIGRAKQHLYETAQKLNQKLKFLNGRALLSVNKALVTQASAAIPVVPLYISLLFRLMKEKGTHEGVIEQMQRLFYENLYSNNPTLDAEGNIRLDDLEMQPDIQEKIAALWPTITTENIEEITDLKGYREDFYRLFGFYYAGVDYNADVDPDVKIDSIETKETV